MRISRRLSVRFPVVVLLLAIFVFGVAPASAGARKAFKIERFTLQTTAPREEPAPNGFDVVNEPYSFTQAGGHPLALTFTARFKTEEPALYREHGKGQQTITTQVEKDIVTVLPAGLLGNPTALPRCSLTVLTGPNAACPAATQVGLARLGLAEGQEKLGPIYNVVPEAGQSAEFAVDAVGGEEFFLTAHLVRSGQGYAITVVDNGIPPIGIIEPELTFWGVPAESRYDWMRGLKCATVFGAEAVCGLSKAEPDESAGVAPVPFLTMGTDCTAGPEDAIMRTDSWEEPGTVSEGKYSRQYKEAVWRMPAVTGCNALAFAPGIEAQPDTLLADEPVGLGVSLKVPQPEEPGVLGTPELRNAVVTLPEGMSISPGIVDGIQACNEAGPEGINFTGPESEEVGLNGELQLAPGHCPNASTVGTAEAVTPLLAEPIEGHVYLARPGCGGPGQAACSETDALDGNLYQLYLELGGAASGPLGDAGVVIKVPGFVEANPATGQLTTKFLENPQLPFSELHINLNGGPRASLDTPAVCGTATTTADLTPWSEPGTTPLPEAFSVAGTPDATPSSYFDVQGCASPTPLRPGFVAGTVTPQAGAYSDFTLDLSRGDREQFVKGIQVHTPPGLSGMLSSVPLCEEPLADQGQCPQASKIGTTRVASGAGSHPFEIEGTVYLTKSYGGAPFGLSIVTDAVAGPFNLGLVVVRARIDVDPVDSTLTITTDETGPYAIPRILDGVPLRLKRVSVDIDRPGFMFNPTNCGAPGAPGAQRVTATVSGSQNAMAGVSSSFAVGGCKSLQFKPAFKVSTSGRTSKADGASLDAKVTYPVTAPGTEANIKSVKVDLPKQLPSRLTTLQKACTAQVFATNPANCPAASTIGIARVSTPLLPVQLTGPVYFVSHGGEAFPSLVVVLQGDGVRVDVTAATFISRKGITSSTFKTVPDVPFTSFELYLPEGKYSALAANGKLCKSKLVMPTAFVAQNGAQIHQNTRIAVTGCAKAKKKRKKHAKTSRAAKASERSPR